jgi:hypothetical protein
MYREGRTPFTSVSTTKLLGRLLDEARLQQALARVQATRDRIERGACDSAANAQGSTVTTATLTSKFSLGHPLMSFIEGSHQAAPEPVEHK